MKLRDALKPKLTAKELRVLRTSYDVIGDIAIIEVPIELKKKEAVIAKTLLGMFKSIAVVAVKQGGHKGKYRRQKLKIAAGEKRLETTHTESGVRLSLNVETCYYSPRLGTERLRIVKQVKPKERILVAGSGIAPYPLVLAKHTKAKEIVGVELNPSAHKYAAKNIIMNKLQDRITLVKGDARKQKLGKFDRVISAMPAEVDTASLLSYVKKGGRLHILDFAPEDNMGEAGERVKQACQSKKRKCRILRTVKAGQHAVRKYRVCVDAAVY